MHTVICIQLLFQFVGHVSSYFVTDRATCTEIRQNHCLGAAWASYQTLGWCSEENQCRKGASDQHEQRVWQRMVGQGLCRDNTCGFQDSRQRSSQCCLRAGKRGHASGHRRKHRRRKEAGMEHRSLSARVHVQAPGVFPRVTQNNHVAISCKRHVLCAKMMLRFIFGKRQQRESPQRSVHCQT